MNEHDEKEPPFEIIMGDGVTAADPAPSAPMVDSRPRDLPVLPVTPLHSQPISSQPQHKESDAANPEIVQPPQASHSGVRWLRVLHMAFVIALLGSIIVLLPTIRERLQLATSSGKNATHSNVTSAEPHPLATQSQPPAPTTPAKGEDQPTKGVPTAEPLKPEPPPTPKVDEPAPVVPAPTVPEPPIPMPEPPAPEKPQDPPAVTPEPPAPVPPPPKIEDGPSLEEMHVASLLEEAEALAATKPNEAIDRYLKIIALRPNRSDLWKNIADLYLARSDREAAAEAYRSFLKHDPKNVAALNNLGVLEMQAGHFEPALKCFELGVETAPDAALFFNLGNLYLKRGDVDRASGAYRRALDFDPNHEAAKFNAALALEQQGRLAEAASTLATLKPDSVEAVRERLRIEAMMGGAEAKRALTVARASEDVDTALAAATGFRKVNELEMALALLDRAVELAPNHATALCNRGVVRQAMGRPLDAIADYEAAVQADTHYADAYFNLGVLREERGELVKALEHYAAAVRERPRMAPAHNNIGVLYLKVNQPAKAVECFRRAIESDPQYASAHLNLGWAYLTQEKRERALEELKTYAAMVPKDQIDSSAVKAMADLEKK